MIMSEVYIENRKSLIDTLASHGEYAKVALKEIITKSSVIANVILVPCSKAITISKSR
jgi:hypothetical protein